VATSSTCCITMYDTALHHIIRCHNVFYCIILHLIVFYTIVYYIILYDCVLYYTILYCTVFFLETRWPPLAPVSPIYKVERVATPIRFSFLIGDGHLLHL
jgi:hypothetical protein